MLCERVGLDSDLSFVNWEFYCCNIWRAIKIECRVIVKAGTLAFMAIVSIVIKVFWLCADKSDCVRNYLYIKRGNFEGISYLNFLFLQLFGFLSIFSSKCVLIECVCISFL